MDATKAPPPLGMTDEEWAAFSAAYDAAEPAPDEPVLLTTDPDSTQEIRLPAEWEAYCQQPPGV